MRAAALLLLIALPAFASTKISQKPAGAPQKPKWLLKSFLKMSEQQPERLLKLAEKLFSDERLRVTSIEPQFAFEWQHRLAMVGALSDLFDPASKSNGMQRKRSRELISRAMLKDPALLVRDGAVESVRRVFRMQPAESRLWRASLERAFFDKENIVQGEGLFIRETILTAMKEGGLKPSKKVAKAALRDQNVAVQGLAQSWKAQAFDDIGAR
jgi:hypothetical protein